MAKNRGFVLEVPRNNGIMQRLERERTMQEAGAPVPAPNANEGKEV